MDKVIWKCNFIKRLLQMRRIITINDEGESVNTSVMVIITIINLWNVCDGNAFLENFLSTLYINVVRLLVFCFKHSYQINRTTLFPCNFSIKFFCFEYFRTIRKIWIWSMSSKEIKRVDHFLEAHRPPIVPLKPVSLDRVMLLRSCIKRNVTAYDTSSLPRC